MRLKIVKAKHISIKVKVKLAKTSATHHQVQKNQRIFPFRPPNTITITISPALIRKFSKDIFAESFLVRLSVHPRQKIKN